MTYTDKLTSALVVL